MERLIKWVILLFIITGSFSCSGQIEKKDRTTSSTQSKLKKAYFASGCFWCVEAIFESVKGVDEVISGYSGGTEPNPTYKQVSSGKTSHAEAVEVHYDPKIISFETLVKVFFGSHDPTTKNQQGPDYGPQYRSIAFYQNDNEKKIIEKYISDLESKKIYKQKIVTQVIPVMKFWPAEEYHQNFEKRNPTNPYVKNVSIPRLQRFQRKYPELLKKKHS